ncbi:hypothetical protein PCANC_03831 [Puccinia coronata f. sp. avenae]|uniref:Uncharacterized protein n=1 Tax=Puccinia coronata f. sp. avenae TaxID=200324 RepID=A0A2N5T7A7_9BASI|nr:hypothetical protein PCANC_03831 [Puccinia coronata f. sp. avenae]
MLSLAARTRSAPLKNILVYANRSFHAGPAVRSPTGQHMAADGEELKSESDKSHKSGHNDWNEKLATHSEAGIRAEKDTRSARDMQEDTLKNDFPSHGNSGAKN